MTPELKGFLLLSAIKMLLVFTIIMIGVALLTLMERKVSAWMQNRHGPNRVGWAGLLQPAADGVKNILKEETLPALANKWLFMLAPAMSFIPALLLSAVIPFAAPLPVDFDFTLGRSGASSTTGRCRWWWPTCRSASSSSSPSARSASTASRSPAGPPTASTRCSAGFAPARR